MIKKIKHGPTGPALCSWITVILITGGINGSVSGQDILPENPLKGRYVFEQKGCIDCHDGNDSGPDLVENEYYGTSLELASTLWNHLPKMLLQIGEEGLSFPNFTTAEFSDLLTYLFYLRYLGKPGDIASGKVFFTEKGCVHCHALAGKGGDGGPDLDQLSLYASPLSLARALWNHGPEMVAEIERMGFGRPRFEKGEIVDLQAYIRSAGEKPSRMRLFQSPGNPQNGKILFEKKGCGICHGFAGDPSESAPDLFSRNWDLSVHEIAGVLWNHGPEMNERMREKDLDWPQFTTGEMADVIAYLYFIGFQDQPGDAALGRAVFRNKGCISCHKIGADQVIENIPPALSLTTSVTMARIMWNHAPVMEKKASEKVLKWPELSGADMVNIYAFLLNTLSKGEK